LAYRERPYCLVSFSVFVVHGIEYKDLGMKIPPFKLASIASSVRQFGAFFEEILSDI